ncbi:hypothetical protein JFV30_07105 [Pseudomonas sp. TH32]|uniref:hypothetical protein n=1 Tax=Pseudomonas sp. TH32 TaxID=2796397 RepID=UPI0019113F1B|nr:hypothetical protein [Pseudomonas sp. TH32]MBK5436632.1 hypothetical protein [Pseudomonas sp. TH32]
MVYSVSGGSVSAIDVIHTEQTQVPFSQKSRQTMTLANSTSGIRGAADNTVYGPRAVGNDAWAQVLTSLNAIMDWLREVIGPDPKTVTPDTPPAVTVVPDKPAPIDIPKPVIPDPSTDPLLRKTAVNPRTSLTGSRPLSAALASTLMSVLTRRSSS